jgi:capsular polysaccharide biosynthesis protein
LVIVTWGVIFVKATGRYEAPIEPYDISLRDLLLSIWRRLWIVLLVAVVFVGAAVGFTLARPSFYESTTVLLVMQKADEVPSSLGTQVEGLGEVTVTLTEVVATRPIANATIQRLGLSMSSDDLLDNVLVEQVPATQVINVAYQDPDPTRAQRVAETIGKVFSGHVAEVTGATGVRVMTWEGAVVPESAGVRPIPLLKSLLLPRWLALILNGFLGLIVGSMVGVGLALVLELLDDSWRSSEEAEEVTGAPVIGVVPPPEADRGAR